MKLFVKFLGYTESENGIQEITQDDNDFNVAEVDLLEMKPKFNNVNIIVRKTDIFKQYDASDFSFTYLVKSINSTATILTIQDVTLSNGDILWIENERIRIDSQNGDLTYNVTRGMNDSISVSHHADTTLKNIIGNIMVSNTRLTPNGLNVEFYLTDNNNNVVKSLGYYFVSEVKSQGNSLVQLEVKPVYERFTDNTIIRVIYPNDILSKYVSFGFFMYSLNLSAEMYCNEFFKLLDITNIDTDGMLLSIKEIDNTNKFASCNLKGAFEQLLNYNNKILVFDSTSKKYKLKEAGKILSTDEYEDIRLLDYITIQSKIEYELSKKYSSIKVKVKVLSELTQVGDTLSVIEDETSFIDYDMLPFTTNSINFETADILFETTTKLENLIINKIRFLNSFQEIISVNSTKWTSHFKVGSVYRITDYKRLNLFSNFIIPPHARCISIDNNEVKFILSKVIIQYLISPSLPFVVKSTALNELVLNLDGISMFDFFFTTDIHDLSKCMIQDTKYPYYEKDDILNCIKLSNNTSYTRTISSVSTNKIVVSSNLTAGLYYVCYPDVAGTPSDSSKYRYFLYEEIGNV